MCPTIWMTKKIIMLNRRHQKLVLNQFRKLTILLDMSSKVCPILTMRTLRKCNQTNRSAGVSSSSRIQWAVKSFKVKLGRMSLERSHTMKTITVKTSVTSNLTPPTKSKIIQTMNLQSKAQKMYSSSLPESLETCCLTQIQQNYPIKRPIRIKSHLNQLHR